MLKKFKKILADTILANLYKFASSIKQKIPTDLKVVYTEDGIQISSKYFKFLVWGRPPGKQPPPKSMLQFVRDNPNILANARRIFKKISEQSLAYLIGRKIGKQGTDIWEGKKPGIDLHGVVQDSIKEVYNELRKAYGEEVVAKLKLK